MPSTRMCLPYHRGRQFFGTQSAHHRPALHPPRHRGQGHHAVTSRRPLNQSALQQTQLNLYDFALFNRSVRRFEIQRCQAYKTVLLQTTEARRGPSPTASASRPRPEPRQNNCKGHCSHRRQLQSQRQDRNQPSRARRSHRNNLFGREQSASLQGTYGLLEQRSILLYQNPHFHAIATSASPSYRWVRQQPGRNHLRGLEARRWNSLD